MAADAATNVVKMGNYWFSPTNIAINLGDSVLWTNTSLTAHDATSTTWATPIIAYRDKYAFRFTNAGYYPYACALHVGGFPQQTGSVTVASSGNVAPTVAITNPPSGAILADPAAFALQATASDNDGSVSQIEFFNGTISLGIDSTSPYGVSVSSLAAGNYTFFAIATDNTGAKATNSATIIVNALPTTALTSPTNGASFTAPANLGLAATASDTDGSVTNVEFFNGATKLGEDATSPYSFAWNNIPAGNYTLTVRATDNRGATTTSTAIFLSVTNAPLSAVTLLSPAMTGSEFTFSVLTEAGRDYTAQVNETLGPSGWQTLTNFVGNGSIVVVRDPMFRAQQRWYRVRGQ